MNEDKIALAVKYGVPIWGSVHDGYTVNVHSVKGHCLTCGRTRSSIYRECPHCGTEMVEWHAYHAKRQLQYNAAFSFHEALAMARDIEHPDRCICLDHVSAAHNQRVRLTFSPDEKDVHIKILPLNLLTTLLFNTGEEYVIPSVGLELWLAFELLIPFATGWQVISETTAETIRAKIKQMSEW